MGEAKRRASSGQPVPAAMRYGASPADAAVRAGIPLVLDDSMVVRGPGPGFDPLRHADPPRLADYVARRCPSAPEGARWRLCGGYVLRMGPAEEGSTAAAIAFRLPGEPHYALLSLVTRQPAAQCAVLREATTMRGLAVEGAFGPGGTFGGTLSGLAWRDRAPEPGMLTLLLPRWDADAFERILRPFDGGRPAA
jgi:hypothetical protein